MVLISNSKKGFCAGGKSIIFLQLLMVGQQILEMQCENSCRGASGSCGGLNDGHQGTRPLPYKTMETEVFLQQV